MYVGSHSCASHLMLLLLLSSEQVPVMAAASTSGFPNTLKGPSKVDDDGSESRVGLDGGDGNVRHGLDSHPSCVRRYLKGLNSFSNFSPILMMIY